MFSGKGREREGGRGKAGVGGGEIGRNFMNDTSDRVIKLVGAIDSRVK